MDRLRKAIVAMLREDIAMIGEPTHWTEELIEAYNDVVFIERGRGVSLPLIDASDWGA